MPKNASSQFAYTELKKYMTEKAKEQNIQLPETFYLIDISFLVFVEASDLAIEIDFFKKNPLLGRVENYPLMGMCMSPVGIPDDVRKTMSGDLENWTWDKLARMMRLIQSFLMSSNHRNVSTVVYIHCEAGKDRTGEISGAYYLEFLRWSFVNTVKVNFDSPPKRQISPDMLNGLLWYCYYLKDKYHYNLNCTL